jgi:YVTN family beta-propeller protein
MSTAAARIFLTTSRRSVTCTPVALALLCATAACNGEAVPGTNAVGTRAGAGAVAGTSSAGNGSAGTTPMTSVGAAGSGTRGAAGRGVAGSSGAAGVAMSGAGRAAANGGAGAEDDAGVAPVADHVECTPNAYVANSGSDSVSAIDTNTHEVVATIKTDTAPVNPTFTPDRKHVYVSNSQSDTLSVIDVATNKATTIKAGGQRPSGLAFLPDGKKLIVTLLGESVSTPGSAVIITLDSGAFSPLIPIGAQPERIALTPDGARAYVSNLGDGTMSVIDVALGKVMTTISLGDLPFNPLMSPDGKLVYVGVMFSNKITMIDTATNQIGKSIDADSPNGMVFDPDFKKLYVTSAFGSAVLEVSLEMGKVVRSEPVGGLPGHVGLLPDGKQLYFVRPDGNTVEVVDTATLKIVHTITVESGPSTVAVCHSPVR